MIRILRISETQSSGYKKSRPCGRDFSLINLSSFLFLFLHNHIMRAAFYDTDR